jgi:hypothetical protein
MTMITNSSSVPLFDDKLIDGGVLNVDQLIKNSRRIHESERISEIFSAFSDLNTTIVDLYAAFTSPAQAAYMVGIEAELYRNEVALWRLGVPLGKYSEAGGSSRVDLQACKLGTGRRFTTS